MNSLFTPLEQFELRILMPFSINGIDFSITSITYYLFLLGGICCVFFFLGVEKIAFCPTVIQSMIEFIYEFIFDILKQQAGPKSQIYFPLYFTVFIFILFSNLIGLLPFGVTITAQLINTFSLAFIFNLGFILIGLIQHKFHFFNLFMPKDAPVFLVPLIVVIEVISYLIRTFSLSLRLFANMMAGHTLLHILASFSIKFVKAGFYVVSIFPFVLVLMVLVLELGIAFLQAYVFVILLSIYLNDSLHPGH
jgi:F-type H+-transporting ATPase subunit a